ncbi:MAG: diguanylate cyclase [Deltaproteobacteria bacterium]|nr:diguanylate cyclase [Deltaproteobacteria bacterium]
METSIVAECEQQESDATALTNKKKSTSKGSDRKKILIVEDDPTVLEMLDDALADEGFLTECVSSAEGAFKEIDTFEPDLVISDQAMPQMTGLDMLVKLRQNENYVSIIFISGQTDVKTICDAFEIGADDYICKPFRLEELIARVKNCLRTKDVHVQLQKANAKLLEMVDRDHLTGLFNMRTMYEKIDFELARARRYGRRVACVMIDMDYFKTVNDNNDHLFGSYVLSEMGEILRQRVRSTDYAARYGGDEFLVVLTETCRQGADIFCERLRKTIEGHTFRNENCQIKLTLSAGYALTGGEEGIDARSLVRQADHSLYEAKAQGRNRIVRYKAPQ